MDGRLLTRGKMQTEVTADQGFLKMQTADYRLLSLHVCGVITIINYFSSIVMKVSVLRLA